MFFVISRFSSAKRRLFLSTTILILFCFMYSWIIGFKFFNNIFLASDLCLAIVSKRLFLSFCNAETLLLKSVTFFLYSSADITFFCCIIFFSSSSIFFSLSFKLLMPFSNLFLRKFWAFLPAILSFKIYRWISYWVYVT